MKRSKKSPLKPWLFLAALLALAGGCAGRSLQALPEGPALELARKIHERGAGLPSLAVRGGADYTAAGRRSFFRFEALAMKPGRLFFTAFDPAGRPAFRLAVAEGRLAGLIYQSRQYAAGPATAENLANFLPLGLSPDQLTALLSGAQVRPAAAGARSVGENTEILVIPEEAPTDETAVWRLRLAGGLEQDPGRAIVLSAVRGPAARPDLTLRYQGTRDLPREDRDGAAEPFPGSLEAEWAWEGRRQRLRVVYDEVRLGPPLDPAVFALERPAGFELVELP